MHLLCSLFPLAFSVSNFFLNWASLTGQLIQLIQVNSTCDDEIKWKVLHALNPWFFYVSSFFAFLVSLRIQEPADHKQLCGFLSKQKS